jgi:hypothetical protein
MTNTNNIIQGFFAIYFNKSQQVTLDLLLNMPVFFLQETEPEMKFPKGLNVLSSLGELDTVNKTFTGVLEINGSNKEREPEKFEQALQEISRLNPELSPSQWEVQLTEYLNYIIVNFEKYQIASKILRIREIGITGTDMIFERFPLYNEGDHSEFASKVKVAADNLIESLDSLSPQEINDMQYFIKGKLELAILETI